MFLIPFYCKKHIIKCYRFYFFYYFIFYIHFIYNLNYYYYIINLNKKKKPLYIKNKENKKNKNKIILHLFKYSYFLNKFYFLFFYFHFYSFYFKEIISIFCNFQQHYSDYLVFSYFFNKKYKLYRRRKPFRKLSIKCRKAPYYGYLISLLNHNEKIRYKHNRNFTGRSRMLRIIQKAGIVNTIMPYMFFNKVYNFLNIDIYYNCNDLLRTDDNSCPLLFEFDHPFVDDFFSTKIKYL